MLASHAWQEIGDGIFRRRYPSLDLNIGVVLGTDAALVVDSRATPSQARQLRTELAQLTDLPVGWLFNTHYHWDHTFGNQCFIEAQLWGQEECRRMLVDHGLQMLDQVLASVSLEEQEALKELVITPPSETFRERAMIDLGNRTAEFVHFGRGHTNSDAVVHVDGVTFAGDLIEEGGPPGVGDSFPISWVETVGQLANEARPVVVPGHGDVVDVEYVVVTRFDLAWIARTAQDAWNEGRTAGEIDLTGAPFPAEVAAEAMSRAYSELESFSKFSQ
jgi:glyoxylase-like metal-dependent hydrolase (beta-lactamase superfamily II)